MKKKLLDLLEKDTIISGEILAENLGISRAAIWKQIESLRRMGYKIESIRNKGYQLLVKPDIPYPEEVRRNLNTQVIGRELYHFKTIHSTNRYARELINKNVSNGTVIVAEVQTQGRGRKDRTWFSPSGGLWFSVILYPSIPPHKGMLLTMVASLSVVEAIRNVTGLRSYIKWPNDVLIKGKKVCGILTEIDTEIDTMNFAIVGIGLNVNNVLQPKLWENATTLMHEYGTRIARVPLFQLMLKNFDTVYSTLLKGDYETIRSKWLSSTQILGKMIRVDDGDTSITGMVMGIDGDGGLVIKTDDGTRTIFCGDITDINEKHT